MRPSRDPLHGWAATSEQGDASALGREAPHECQIGHPAVASSALRFYEDRGVITSERAALGIGAFPEQSCAGLHSSSSRRGSTSLLRKSALTGGGIGH